MTGPSLPDPTSDDPRDDPFPNEPTPDQVPDAPEAHTEGEEGDVQLPPDRAAPTP